MNQYSKLTNFKSFFNINVIFPHIGKIIIDKWGSPEFDEYMLYLMTDTRGGTRTGFCKNAIKDLNLISSYHSRIYSSSPIAPTKIKETDQSPVIEMLYSTSNKKLMNSIKIEKTIQNISNTSFSSIANDIRNLTCDQDRISYIKNCMFKSLCNTKKPSSYVIENLIVLLKYHGEQIDEVQIT